MKKIHLVIVAVIFLLVSAGIVYFNYQTFRQTVELPITSLKPSDNLISINLPEVEQMTMTKPEFQSVAEADMFLNDDGLGLAVRIGTNWRYYPYQLLTWHQLINDDFNDKPILITFSPLTYSGKVFSRNLNGQVLDFTIAEQLYNSNLVFTDVQTGSLFNQLLGKGILGQNLNQELTHVRATVMSWSTFRQQHPEEEVLSWFNSSSFDYTQDPYLDYYQDQAQILYPLTKTDTRLPTKEVVYGVEIDQTRRAYPLTLIQEKGRINDKINDTEISLTWDEDTNIVRAFEPQITEIIDGSAGDVLDPTVKIDVEIATDHSFWFSWAAIFPKTELYEM